MPAASGLEEYCFDSGHCVDLIAIALPTIDLMNSCIRVGSMKNPSAVGHALMILRWLDYGGAKQCLLLVSIAATASLGPEPLEELVLFPASMPGVGSLI